MKNIIEEIECVETIVLFYKLRLLLQKNKLILKQTNKRKKPDVLDSLQKIRSGGDRVTSSGNYQLRGSKIVPIMPHCLSPTSPLQTQLSSHPGIKYSHSKYVSFKLKETFLLG